MKHKPAKGHTKKHTGSGKHGGTGKHHPVHHKPAPSSGTGGAGGGPHGGPPNVVAKHPHHPKARGLALGEAWPCCAVEAVAASLRLAGGSVTDADVLALHEYAGGTADAGVPLLVALEAAAEVGLAGVRPAEFNLLDLGYGLGQTDVENCELVRDPPERLTCISQPPHECQFVQGAGAALARSEDSHVTHHSGLLLGADLPGSHAFAATTDTWWSWGQPYCPCEFPDAVIEEAWSVRWAA